MTRLQTVECKITIANNTSQSAEVDLCDRDIVAVKMPALWTAASLTFLSAGTYLDGARPTTPESFLPVFGPTATEVSVSVAASQYIVLDQATQFLLRGLGRTKVRSGTNAVPVAQAQDVLMYLICERPT